MAKAHEIQEALALGSSFNSVALDHVVIVKVSSTAINSHMLGLSKAQTATTISQAWGDGQSMRTYWHSPNTMSRKSWELCSSYKVVSPLAEPFLCASGANLRISAGAPEYRRAQD